MGEVDGSKMTARREFGAHHDQDIAKTYGGKWVVRDERGAFVDWHQYRNDLLEWYPGLKIIGD